MNLRSYYSKLTKRSGFFVLFFFNFSLESLALLKLTKYFIWYENCFNKINKANKNVIECNKYWVSIVWCFFFFEKYLFAETKSINLFEQWEKWFWIVLYTIFFFFHRFVVLSSLFFSKIDFILNEMVWEYCFVYV